MGVWNEDVPGDGEWSENWLELNGDYRALLLRPKKMRWAFLSKGGEGGSDPPEAEGGSDDGEHVRIQFDLPPGAYATMALREAMRTNPAPSRAGHIRFDDGE